MKETNIHTIQVRIPLSTLNKIEQLAIINNETRSKVVRDLLILSDHKTRKRAM